MILKLIRFFSLPLLTLIGIWALGWLWFATSIALMKPITEIKTTQAIVVLTGGNGRINEGLNMLAEEIAPNLFISGVHKDTTKKDIFNSWKKPTKKEPCCLTLGYKSTDTITNATEVRDWVTENNIDEFHLVTSSYHMPRASMEIKNQLPDIKIIKHPVFSQDFQSWKGRFWKLTFSEYNKTLVRWMQSLGA
jgi:uncharacterized SAM-binding protein YcdF (DUF218 family)